MVNCGGEDPDLGSVERTRRHIHVGIIIQMITFFFNLGFLDGRDRSLVSLSAPFHLSCGDRRQEEDRALRSKGGSDLFKEMK